MGGTDLLVRFIGLDLVSRVAERAGNSVDRLENRIRRSGAASSQSLIAAGISLTTFGVSMLAAGGAMAAAAEHFTQAAATFQSDMVMVVTHGGLAAYQIKSVSDALIDMAPQVGYGPDALAKSFYYVQSAVTSLNPKLQDTTSLLDIQRQAAQLAAIGHADLTDTTNLLVGTLAAYHDTSMNASQAAAILNATVGNGKVTMQELDTAMRGGLLATAHQAGISLDSLGASFGTLTDMGYGASQSATYLRSAIIQMSMPSGPAAKALEAIGLSGEATAKQMGYFSEILSKAGITQTEVANKLQTTGSIGEVLKMLQERMVKLGMSAPQAAALIERSFGGIRSGQAMVGLMNNIQGVIDKTGRISVATQHWTDTWDYYRKNDPQFLINSLGAQMQALEVVIGGALIPLLSNLIGWLQPIIYNFEHWAEANPDLVQGLALLVIGGTSLFGVLMTLGGAVLILGGSLPILAGAMAGLVGIALPLAAILGVGAVAWAAFGNDALPNINITDTLHGLFTGLRDASEELGRDVAALSVFWREHRDEIRLVAGAIATFLIPVIFHMGVDLVTAAITSAGALAINTGAALANAQAYFIEGVAIMRTTAQIILQIGKIAALVTWMVVVRTAQLGWIAVTYVALAAQILWNEAVALGGAAAIVISEALGFMRLAYAILASETLRAASATEAMTAAQGALDAVMAINPVFLLAAALVVLVGLLVIATTNVFGLRDAMAGWFQNSAPVVGFFRAINDAIVGTIRWFQQLPQIFKGILADLLLLVGVATGSVPLMRLAWAELGRSIPEGLAHGIENALSVVGGALKHLASSAVTWFKNLLGIHSPSTVFEGFGQDIVAGLGLGISGDQQAALGPLGDLTGAMTSQTQESVAQMNANIQNGMRALNRVLASETGVSRAQIRDFSRELQNDPTQAADYMASQMKTSMDSVRDSVQTDLSGINTDLSSWSTNFGDQAAQAGAGFGDSLSKAMTDSTGAIRDAARALGDSAIGALGDAQGRFTSIGRAIGQGMVNGINEMSPAVAAAAADAVTGAVVSARAAGNIQSPSRVFAEKVGEPISQGIAVGIAKSSHMVNASVGQTVSGAADTNRRTTPTSSGDESAAILTQILAVLKDGQRTNRNAPQGSDSSNIVPSAIQALVDAAARGRRNGQRGVFAS